MPNDYDLVWAPGKGFVKVPKPRRVRVVELPAACVRAPKRTIYTTSSMRRPSVELKDWHGSAH